MSINVLVVEIRTGCDQMQTHAILKARWVFNDGIGLLSIDVLRNYERKSLYDGKS